MPAQFNIGVALNAGSATASANVLGNSLKKTKGIADDLGKTLKNVFSVLAIRQAIDELYRYSEAYISIRNRINSTSSSQNNLTTQMEATYEIAQKTRTSWDATSIIYSRLGRNTKDLGVSQKELLTFTSQLNMAIRAYGPTTAEAKSGIIQLSQAMSAGTLRGQDLHSVMEQLPTVAGYIAKGMGISIGQLRQFGKEGKITTRAILDAMQKEAPEIEAEFAKMTPRISDAFVVVGNAITKFVGEANEASGITLVIVNALIFLAQHMDVVGKIVIIVGQIIAIQFGVKGIGVALTYLKQFAMWIATNPTTALLYAMVALVLVLRQFGDEMKTNGTIISGTTKVTITIGDSLRALWQTFKDLGGVIFDFLAGAWNQLSGALGEGVNMKDSIASLHDFLRFLAYFVGTVGGLFKVVQEEGIKAFGALAIAIASKMAEAFNSVMKNLAELINGARDAIFNFINKTNQKRKAADESATIDNAQWLATHPKDIAKIEAQANKTTGYDPNLKASDVGMSGNMADINKFRDAQNKLRNETWEEVWNIVEARRGSVRDLKLNEAGFNDDGSVDGRTYVQARQIDPHLGGLADDAKNYLGDLRSEIQAYGAKAVREFDENEANSALNRAKKKTDQLDSGGPKTGETAAEKGLKALLAQLEALLKKSNPITKAKEDYRLADDLLSKPIILRELKKRGLDPNVILNDLFETLEPKLDPLAHWSDKVNAEVKTYKGSNEDYEREAEVLKVIDDLKEKGRTGEYELAKSEIDDIRTKIASQQESLRIWKAEQSILSSIQDSLKEYNRTLAATAELEKEHTITSVQAENERRKAYEGYEAGQKPIYEDAQKRSRTGGDSHGIGTDSADYGLKEGTAEFFSKENMEQMINLAATVKKAWTDTFQAIEDSIIHAVETGDMQWEKLGETILHLLNQIAIKIAETAILQAIFPGFGMPGTGSVPGGGTVQGFITSPSQVDLGSHATGGSVTVGGHGAPDSILAYARVSPGERVDFTPKGQTKDSGYAYQKGGGGGGVVIHNSYDKRDLLSVIRTPDGQREMINFMTNNRQAVRGILGM